MADVKNNIEEGLKEIVDNGKGNTSNKIKFKEALNNFPLKKILKGLFSLVLIVVLLVVFITYLLNLPTIKPTVKNSNLKDMNITQFDKFCSAQITSTGGTSGGGVTAGGGGTTTDSGTTTTTPGSAPRQPLTCPAGNVEYRCDGSSPVPFGLIPPPAPPYTITQSKCKSNKKLDTTARWCDVPNLPNDTSRGVQGILDQKVELNCCKEKKDDKDNWYYIRLVLYLLLSIPIIYIIVIKYINLILKRDNKEISVPDDIESKLDFWKGIIKLDSFNTIGEYISKNGLRWFIFIITIYLISLPLFRFFYVSYKCEDVTSTSSKCGESCNSDTDCATLHGTGCIMCINNVCENQNFIDGQSNVALGNIELSVCSLRSIINDLTSDEIDDLYSRYKTTPEASSITPIKCTTASSDTAKTTCTTSKKNYLINNVLNDDAKAKEVTSYYYKFYPRQELSINDTINPFRVRLPSPKKLKADGSGDYESIPGFDYLLNNYIELDDYTPPTTPADVANCSATSEIMCNKNHNCKWANQTCSSNVCPGTNPKRYKIPGNIQAVVANQSTDDLSLHNKVFRSGKDYNTTTNSYPENMYPCNDVVLSNNLKASAKSTTQTSSTITPDMSTWINHFELKRTECADKLGKCYMDNYVCQTKNGTPIPLKDLQHPDPRRYTVSELSDIGCQKALYPCDASTITTERPNPPCTALKESNGYIVEVPLGGTCKYAKWNVNTWQSLDANSNDPARQTICIPNDIPSVAPGSNYTFDTFQGAKVADWIKTPTGGGINTKEVNSHCNAVNRMPRSNIPDTPPSTLSHYFRWSSLGTPGRPLCSDWPGTCSTAGKVKNLQGTYVGNRQQEMCCIDQNTSNNPVSLYVTGDLAAGASPNTISGIVPKGNCNELTTVNCPTGKTKSNTGKFTVGQEARDCCS